jgi:hypothetical protein
MMEIFATNRRVLNECIIELGSHFELDEDCCRGLDPSDVELRTFCSTLADIVLRAMQASVKKHGVPKFPSLLTKVGKALESVDQSHKVGSVLGCDHVLALAGTAPPKIQDIDVLSSSAAILSLASNLSHWREAKEAFDDLCASISFDSSFVVPASSDAVTKATSIIGVFSAATVLARKFGDVAERRKACTEVRSDFNTFSVVIPGPLRLMLDQVAGISRAAGATGSSSSTAALTL